ncbi:hypothetical protein L218DRAFT_273561 [Marasmius fiardii PR-910]|nr:hypothetical protein L218DRAFT_273561 [Marasmius fiardii PR-910]
MFLPILILAGYSVAATPPYYIIPNAETPSLGRPGLTPIGEKRAEVCIPGIFAKLNIGQIISCKIKGHECAEANQTALPLATLLGLNITTWYVLSILQNVLFYSSSEK